LEGVVYKPSKKQETKKGRDFGTVQRRISHTDMARETELGEWYSLRACSTLKESVQCRERHDKGSEESSIFKKQSQT
jgi:hypothetical protein